MTCQYKIKVTEEMGRGLCATQALPKDTILGRFELLVLSAEDTKKLHDTELFYYLFLYEGDRECLVLGDGELFNHSDDANVTYTLIDYDGRKVMEYRTNRYVAPDEQLFINYTLDKYEDVSKYPGHNLLG